MALDIEFTKSYTFHKVQLYKRNTFDKIQAYLGDETIIVLIGARQVGKTHILYYIQKFLEKKGKKVFYYDLEYPELLNTLNGGVDSFTSDLSGKGYKKGQEVFVLIDEIQYMEDPTKFLKIMHDHYPNIKLLVSGSSTFEIKKKFKESLVGRTVNFEVYPLSFEEFLIFKGKNYKITKNMTDYKMLQGVPYNILPANVLLAEDITSFEKLLYTEILALSNRAGYCWAENKHFATVFKIHITNISKSINNLKAHNYIAVTFLHKGINNVQRRIFINHQKFTDWLINEKKQQHLQYSELDDYKSAEELGLDSLVEGDTEKITPPLSENTKLDFTSLAKTPNYYFSENTKLIINHTNKALKYINILIKGNGDQKTEKETELNNKIFSVNLMDFILVSCFILYDILFVYNMLVTRTPQLLNLKITSSSFLKPPLAVSDPNLDVP